MKVINIKLAITVVFAFLAVTPGFAQLRISEQDKSKLKTTTLTNIIYNERDPSQFFERMQAQFDKDGNSSFRVVYTIATVKYFAKLKKKQEKEFSELGGYLEFENIFALQALKYFTEQMKIFRIDVKDQLIIVDVKKTKTERSNKELEPGTADAAPAH